MSEVKNEGLEVVGWRRVDRQWEITTYPSVCATWHKIGAPVEAITSHSEALAGYAVRDARIAELEAESAEWSPVMQRLGDENQQLRAKSRAKAAGCL